MIQMMILAKVKKLKMDKRGLSEYFSDNKVRFSSTAEVRSLPDSQSESIARMSHINAQRARQGRRIYRSAQKLTHVAKVCRLSISGNMQNFFI